MTYLNNLPHEPGCPAGDRDLIPFNPDGSFGDTGPCTCRRAEALARVEAMNSFVEAFRAHLDGRPDLSSDDLTDAELNAHYQRQENMMDAFDRLEDE